MFLLQLLIISGNQDATVKISPESNLGSEFIENVLYKTKMAHPGFKKAWIDDILRDLQPHFSHLKKSSKGMFKAPDYEVVEVPYGVFVYIGNWVQALEEYLDEQIPIDYES